MRSHRTGLLARCRIADRQLVDVAVRPVLRRSDQLNQPELVPLDDPAGRQIADRVVDLSRELATALRRRGDELVVGSIKD
jgi:hypothetical protein